jgi:hypothetical protein
VTLGDAAVLGGAAVGLLITLLDRLLRWQERRATRRLAQLRTGLAWQLALRHYTPAPPRGLDMPAHDYLRLVMVERIVSSHGLRVPAPAPAGP